MKPKFLEAAERLAADLGITVEELLRRNDAALAADEEMDDPCQACDEDTCLCDEEWCEFCGEERPCECDDDADYEHWDIADID